jgi:hypothetical protein
VPEANMFPNVEGLRGPFTCLNSARYGIAWGITGALEDCISRARTYALERKQFKGNPIAKYQLVQKKLADAATDAAFGTIASIQVGRLKDKGLAAPEMISMIKRQNCDRALYNARTLQEIFGGNAVSDEYGIGRHVANLFVTQTYEGQSDIHSKLPTISFVDRMFNADKCRSHPWEGNHRYTSICIRGLDGTWKMHGIFMPRNRCSGTAFETKELPLRYDLN